MLKCCSLYSGSTGNSFFVQTEDTKLLVDCGVSCKKIENALSSLNVLPENINGILLTHEHPHDAANPCGFNIFKGKKKISIATDLGHVSKDVIKSLENSSLVMLEANYDFDVLQYSSYPYVLKKRISGPNGHLENNVTGKTIAHLIDSGLENALLIHLSKENNFPELAYKTVSEELQKQHFSESDINLNVAPRDLPSNFFNVI